MGLHNTIGGGTYPTIFRFGINELDLLRFERQFLLESWERTVILHRVVFKIFGREEFWDVGFFYDRSRVGK